MKEIVNGMTNEMKLEFDSRSANEAFARVTVASFMTQLNPTLEEVSDVKTAVSEAVTNAIIHGYENHVNKVQMRGLKAGHCIWKSPIGAWESQM